MEDEGSTNEDFASAIGMILRQALERDKQIAQEILGHQHAIEALEAEKQRLRTEFNEKYVTIGTELYAALGWSFPFGALRLLALGPQGSVPPEPTLRQFCLDQLEEHKEGLSTWELRQRQLAILSRQFERRSLSATLSTLKNHDHLIDFDPSTGVWRRRDEVKEGPSLI